MFRVGISVSVKVTQYRSLIIRGCVFFTQKFCIIGMLNMASMITSVSKVRGCCIKRPIQPGVFAQTAA